MATADSALASAIARLLRPRSIAAIGGETAVRVLRQCQQMGFAGELWPVHPRRGSMAGRPVFRSIAELPEAPDAAFVGVNRHATIDTVAALAQRGAGGAICYASGFREADDGAALQTALVQAAAEMPIIGPNCYGLINFLDGAPLWPDQQGGRRLGPGEQGVAIITQSSNIAISMTMQRRGLPIAYMVTAGNQAQLGISRLAAAILDDPRVAALGLHVEGFDSAAGFEALADKARQRAVPVVVMKTGHSERGSASNLSHTASVAGSGAAAEAFLQRLGFARARSIPELLETLKLLLVHGPLDGVRTGAMCCSGGEAALLADAAEDTGLIFPELASGHAAAVTATVNPLVTVANPFDYHTFHWGDGAALNATFTAFTRGNFDATLLVLDFPRADRCDGGDWQITLEAFAQAVQTAQSRGVVVATLAENLPEDRAAWLIGQGIAPLGGVHEAFTALQCAATIGATWRAPRQARLLPAACLPNAPILLDEAAAKARLAELGVEIPPGAIAHSADEAVTAAASLGGAVALKALGIAHKTERRAVRLGLSEPGSIRAAAQDLLACSDRLLVERFLPGSTAELIVGVHRDPQFGLLLTVGSGGTLVELLADTVTLLLPVTEADVRRALSRLRCAALLDGYRGKEPADLDAAVRAILAIAGLAAVECDRLEELDVNPLGVGGWGRGAVALDALIRTREAES